MLRDDKLISHEPTRYPQSEELQIGQIRFRTHGAWNFLPILVFRSVAVDKALGQTNSPQKPMG